jgi:hypothetical protein
MQPETILFTPSKNWLNCQYSDNGKNDTTVEHECQKRTLFPSWNGCKIVKNIRYEFWKQFREVSLKD